MSTKIFECEVINCENVACDNVLVNKGTPNEHYIHQYTETIEDEDGYEKGWVTTVTIIANGNVAERTFFQGLEESFFYGHFWDAYEGMCRELGIQSAIKVD